MDYVKQLSATIENNQRMIRAARESNDHAMVAKMLKNQVKLLELVSPHVKSRPEPEKGYPSLKKALKTIPDDVIKQILIELDRGDTDDV